MDDFHLEGFKPIRGAHCESSAMLNLLRYQGYDIGEEQIIGAGAALGFYLGSSPFPFLGGRTLRLRENFTGSTGIAWQTGGGERDGNGWEKITGLLRGGTPVVLRVDMRYLPYLYGGRYGSRHMSFGWHLICLAGLDEKRKMACVTDTDREGLQKIKLSDLNRARFSNTRIYPPKGEFYWTGRASPTFRFDWETIARRSLRVTTESMTEGDTLGEDLTGLEGLSQYPRILKDFDRRIKPYLLSPVLAFHYGCIETNGTGGAAFRKMYHRFLRETGEKTGDAYLLEAANLLKPASEGWTALAGEMKRVSDIKSAPLRKRWGAEGEKLARRAADIYESEKRFYDFIQETRR